MTPHVVFNGASGGLGRHLRAALVNQGLPTAHLGSRLGDSVGLTDELEHLPIEPDSPVVFIQSAGMVSVGECERNPAQAFDVNVTRTIDTARDFVEWAIDRSHPPGIVFVSSGHVYAPPERGEPLSESSPTGPRSVYAETKLEGEVRMIALAEGFGVDLAVGRVFGMIGPDQRPHYLVPGLIRRAHDGDLSAVPGLDYVRDYLDTRDVSRHLASLASMTPGHQGATVVNICSGEETRIGDLLDQLLALVHEGDPDSLRQARNRVNAAPGRPSDVEWSVGDPSLLASLTSGPIQTISIEESLSAATETAG
jgi:nucleoside-diphosphate-sugar epimerase